MLDVLFNIQNVSHDPINETAKFKSLTAIIGKQMVNINEVLSELKPTHFVKGPQRNH